MRIILDSIFAVRSVIKVGGKVKLSSMGSVKIDLGVSYDIIRDGPNSGSRLVVHGPPSGATGPNNHFVGGSKWILEFDTIRSTHSPFTRFQSLS